MSEINWAPEFVRHRDDEWWDEIRLVSDETKKPVLRIVTLYRYKTSGLSGDEWRTSVMWQTTLPMVGAEPSDSQPTEWLNFDGPYWKIEQGLAALYPGLYTSQKAVHNHPIK